MHKSHRSHTKSTVSKKQYVSWLAAAVILIGAAAAVGVGISLSKRPGIPLRQATTPVFGDVTIEGVSVKGMSAAKARGAVLASLEKRDGNRRYELTYQEHRYTLPGNRLHLSYNLNATLQKAWHAPSSAQKQAYRLEVSVDRTALQAQLRELTKPLDRTAVEPTIRSFDGNRFTFQDGAVGLRVQMDPLLDRTAQAIAHSVSEEVPIPVETVPYKHSVQDLQEHIIRLGSFTTTSLNTADGTYNMAKALRTVNGTVIPAGSTFSYLGIIGDANRAKGYKMAGALENGLSTQAYGGGVCQGSTTIYGAALRSACEIVERSPHSSPSAYVPIGQDATVAYPSLDFKFRNPTDYPMYIQSGANGRTMFCTIYGYKDSSWDKIEISSRQTSTEAPPAAILKKDSSKPAGYRQQTVSALPGRHAVCTRTYYKNGTVVRTEQMPSSYYPPRAAQYITGSAKPAVPKPAKTSSSAVSKPPQASSSVKPAA